MTGERACRSQLAIGGSASAARRHRHVTPEVELGARQPCLRLPVAHKLWLRIAMPQSGVPQEGQTAMEPAQVEREEVPQPVVGIGILGAAVSCDREGRGLVRVPLPLPPPPGTAVPCLSQDLAAACLQHIAHKNARALSQAANARVVAVGSRDAARAAALLERCGVEGAAAYGSYDEVGTS